MSLGYYHAALLANHERLELYQKAINEIICPGDVVVDLGAGTGILALLAARAGARRVFAIERSPISHLAKRIVRESPFGDRIEIICSAVGDAELPELADVAVTDTSEVDVLMAFARRRLLKVDARIIPLGFAYRITAVELAPQMHQALSIHDVAGFDMSALALLVSQSVLSIAHHELSEDKRLSDEVLLRSWLSGDEETGAWHVELRIGRQGWLGGLALLRTVTLTNSVGLKLQIGVPSYWRCPILPVGPPTEVCEGDVLRCVVSLGPLGVGAWRVTHVRGSHVLGRFDSSPHFERAILGERSHPYAIVPHNGRKRDFSETVLRAVNGKRSVTDIFRLLSPEYPEPWASEEAVFLLLKRAELL